MSMTLLGISGSLTAGGSTRTAIEYALRAAKARYPDITTEMLDLREVRVALCDGRALEPTLTIRPRWWHVFRRQMPM
jgi:NAD(P)H-dependent FMN reductase